MASTKERVLYSIRKTKRRLERGVDATVLGGAVYKLMDAVSRTMLAHQEGGSVADVKGEDGTPLWTVGQAELIEGGLQAMKGGADGSDVNPQADTTQVDTKEKYAPPLFDSSFDPSKFSLDDMYYNTKKYLAELDKKNKVWSMKGGPIAFIKKKEADYIVTIPTTVPIQVPVPPRLMLSAANTFLETLRILTTVGPLESGFLRTITSISTAMFEVFNGNWKNGALSLLGVISPMFVYVGTLGKSFRFIYGFINPTIQDDIEDSLFEGGKSMFIGAWLWLFSVIAPAPIRAEMEKLQNKLVEQMANFNEQIKAAEQKIQETLNPRGMTMNLQRLKPGMIPSFDDIQNIQSILMMKEIQCLDATQEILKSLMEEPVLRFIFELMGIKTSAEKRAEFCAGVPTTLVAAATQSLVGPATPIKDDTPGTSETSSNTTGTSETSSTAAVINATRSTAAVPTSKSANLPISPQLGQLKTGGRRTRRRRSRQHRKTKRKIFS